MALYNENRQITIDEEAAARDVQRLREVAEKIEASMKAIRSMTQSTESFQGETKQAIDEKNLELIDKMTKLQNRLNESADFINRTVQHYQAVDAALKQTVETTLDGSVSGVNIGATAAVASKVKGC